MLVALLAPIGRLTLTSGIGIDQFVRAAKQAYVENAVRELFPGNSRVNISRLSVATGLTRKEVSLLLDKPRGRQVHLIPRTKEQRAIRVLRGWRSDPRFHGRSSVPAHLPLRGEGKSFASLVKIYGGDVTPTSVLRELERIGMVSVTRSGLLRLSASTHRFRRHAPQHMHEVARLLGDFVSTLAQSRSNGSSPAFVGYRDCAVTSPDETALFQRIFSRRAAALLESFDQWRDSRREARRSSDNRVGVGIGVYLVRKGAADLAPVARLTPKVRSRRTSR